MTKKKVLVIENRLSERTLLETRLRENGFEVIVAANAMEARALAERHWKELDVAILDMKLTNDRDDRTTPTGADIASEVSQKINSFRPELLIYSIETEIDFYRTSLGLGTAAYLLKNASDVRAVTRHVKALALRRAINVENPDIGSELNRIVVNSKTKTEALLTFCEGIFKRELDACLGAQFIVLFTEDNRTQNCASSDAGLPLGESTFYHTLQALVHGKGNLTEPFVLESGELDPPADQQTAELHHKLDQAAFLPLALTSGLKLSVGILRQDDSPAEPKALCHVLGHYLRATDFENVINIWSQWTELHATRASIVKLCTLVGQEIRDAGANDSGRLETLANDLTDTGQFLDQLEIEGPQERQVISGDEILSDVWERVSQMEDNPEIQFEPSGNCLLLAQKPDLDFIFSRLLQWFVWRTKNMPLDVEPSIKITCQGGERDSTIIFEDNSHRLPPALREDLFAPFTQAVSIPFPRLGTGKKKTRKPGTRKPTKTDLNLGSYFPLYLVKMLVEGRYHGLLKDRSDEITEHSYGHRIVMQFPAS